MTPAEKIRKLIEEAEVDIATYHGRSLSDDDDMMNCFRAVARLETLRECLAIVEEAERECPDA